MVFDMDRGSGAELQILAFDFSIHVRYNNCYITWHHKDET